MYKNSRESTDNSCRFGTSIESFITFHSNTLNGDEETGFEKSDEIRVNILKEITTTFIVYNFVLQPLKTCISRVYHLDNVSN